MRSGYSTQLSTTSASKFRYIHQPFSPLKVSESSPPPHPPPPFRKCEIAKVPPTIGASISMKALTATDFGRKPTRTPSASLSAGSPTYIAATLASTRSSSTSAKLRDTSVGSLMKQGPVGLFYAPYLGEPS